MFLLPLLRVTLPVVLGLLPVPRGLVGPVDSVAVGRDTTSQDQLLTAGRLAEYIAVKQALQTYWGDLAHRPLLATARNGGTRWVIQFPQGDLPTFVFDYATLVTHDSALAAIFTTNHLAPADFAGTQVAVMRALGWMFVAAGWRVPLPAASTPVGQNVALVSGHHTALTSVGVAVANFTPRLTPDLLTRYIAVKKALRPYWQTSAPTPLREVAKGSVLHPAFIACKENWFRVAHVYDYPALVTQDTTLAALFTRAHFAPALFADVQVAAWQAVMELEGNEASPGDCQLPAGIVGENVAVVRGLRAVLEAVGVVPTSPTTAPPKPGFIGAMGGTPSQPLLWVYEMEP